MVSDYHQKKTNNNKNPTKQNANNFAVFTLKCWEYLNINHSKAGESKEGFDSVQYGIKAILSPEKFSFSYKRAVK